MAGRWCVNADGGYWAKESVSLAFCVCVCDQCPSAMIRGPYLMPLLPVCVDSGFWRWCSNRSSWNPQLRHWISTGTRPRVWPRRQNTKPGQVLRCVNTVGLLGRALGDHSCGLRCSSLDASQQQCWGIWARLCSRGVPVVNGCLSVRRKEKRREKKKK